MLWRFGFICKLLMPLPIFTVFPVFLLSQLWTLSTHYLINEWIYSAAIILRSFRQWNFKGVERRVCELFGTHWLACFWPWKSSTASNFNFMVKYENCGNQVPPALLIFLLSSFSANSRAFTFDLIWPNSLSLKKKVFTQFHCYVFHGTEEIL